jgi:hypothetical protein
LTTIVLESLRSCALLPNTAHAAYGDGTNIVLPSYIDLLIEKNSSYDTSKEYYIRVPTVTYNYDVLLPPP